MLAACGAVAATAGLLVGCPSLGGLTSAPDAGALDAAGPDVVDASPTEAAPSDATSTDTGNGSSCTHARWPGAPDAGSGSGDAGRFVLALQTFNLDPTNPAEPIGLDLDDQCTCPGPESCGAAMDSGITCDNADGRDPVFNRLLLQLAEITPPIGPAGIQAVVTQGRANYLLRISSYNGLADDAEVAVELFVSTGTTTDDAGAHVTPQFDGTDQWEVLSSSAIDTGSSTFVSVYFDLGAYVANHVLVAHPADAQGFVPTFDEYLGPGAGNGNPLILYLSDAVITGTLTPTSDGSFSLQNAFFGARIPTDGPLGGLAALTQVGLCSSSPLFAQIRAELCPARDLATRAANDNTGASCAAISLGASFVATPALLGPVVSRALVPSGCADASVPACP